MVCAFRGSTWKSYEKSTIFLKATGWSKVLGAPQVDGNKNVKTTAVLNSRKAFFWFVVLNISL